MPDQDQKTKTDGPVCRCGWDGTGEHLCHRCGKQPGTPRFITSTTCLAGVQMKLGARETFGCDACWADFNVKRGVYSV